MTAWVEPSNSGSRTRNIRYQRRAAGRAVDFGGSRPGFRDDFARHSDLMSLGIPG
jgi:hypothetical protein